MARNRVKGITVEIGGDTKKFNKAIEGLNKDLSKTSRSLKFDLANGPFTVDGVRIMNKGFTVFVDFHYSQSNRETRSLTGCTSWKSERRSRRRKSGWRITGSGI